MLVCPKCGFSKSEVQKCPQCRGAWLEEKSISHNKDYTTALEVYQEFDDYNEDGELVFSDWLYARLNSQK